METKESSSSRTFDDRNASNSDKLPLAIFWDVNNAFVYSHHVEIFAAYIRNMMPDCYSHSFYAVATKPFLEEKNESWNDFNEVDFCT